MSTWEFSIILCRAWVLFKFSSRVLRISSATSTTVTFSAVSSNCRAASIPTRPPPMTRTLPVRGLPHMASLAVNTLAPSIPLILGMKLREPAARITASNSERKTSWEVAVLFRTTFTPASRTLRIRYSSYFFTSILKSGAPAATMLPPRKDSFSHRVTLWPRSAATRAAVMPPGPPPMTRTFLGSAAGMMG